MSKPARQSRWENYTRPCYDELLDSTGSPRPAAAELTAWLDTLDDQALAERRQAAELAIRQMQMNGVI